MSSPPATTSGRRSGRSNIPSLTAAFLASVATGGNTYAFGLYGLELKRRLALSEGELDTIATAFFAAGLLSFLPGSVSDRFGTRVAMMASGLCSALTLTSFWCLATERVTFVPRAALVPVLATLQVLIFMSNSLGVGAVFKTVYLAAGPADSGTAVGVAKGLVGMGAGLYACLFGVLLPNAPKLDFLLLVAVLAMVSLFLPAYFLLPGKDEMGTGSYDSSDRHFRVLYGGLGLLVLLILYHVHHELNMTADVLTSSSNFVLTALFLFIWIGPIGVFYYLPRDSEVEASFDGSALTDDSSGSLASESSPLLRRSPSGIQMRVGSHAQLKSLNLPQRAHDEDELYDNDCLSDGPRQYNLQEMLSTTTAHLLLWATTVLVGSGTVVTNNLGQIVQALELPAVLVPACLAVFSVCQAVSRVVTGTLSDGRRAECLILASAVAVLAHGLLYHQFLIMGVALAGISFGMTWPLMVLLLGEVFGHANLGGNYMFYDGFTCAAGTLLLSKGVAQHVYERHIATEGGTVCYGSGCFGMTHVITMGLAATSLMASYGVYRRTMRSNPALKSAATWTEPSAASPVELDA